MNIRSASAVVTMLVVVSVGSQILAAQWTKVPISKIPRTADGKPNLSAPVAAAGRREAGSVRGLVAQG